MYICICRVFMVFQSTAILSSGSHLSVIFIVPAALTERVRHVRHQRSFPVHIELSKFSTSFFFPWNIWGYWVNKKGFMSKISAIGLMGFREKVDSLNLGNCLVHCLQMEGHVIWRNKGGSLVAPSNHPTKA